MSRNILAVIIGIVFSIIFLELTIKFCAIMGIGPIGEEIIAIKKMPSKNYFETYGFNLMQQISNFSRFFIFPFVFLLTGLVISVIAKSKKGLCVFIGIIPLAILSWFIHSSLLLTILYIFLTLVAIYLISYFKKIRKA